MKSSRENMRLLAITVAVFGILPLYAAEDILVSDFEANDYGGWTTTGEAFGNGPARGTFPGQMPVDGFLGQGLVNSFLKGDASTGTLTSPSFKLERRYLRFLIGGGGFPGKTCMNLKVGGQVVRTATGPNTQPGGSEHLAWQQWDVSEFAQREAELEIVDLATTGWGHINVDHIVQTDRKLPQVLSDVTRELTIVKPYLNLPIRNGAPKRRMSVLAGGKVEREFEIELAEAEPDWWAFMDLAPFQNKTVVLKVDKLPEDSAGLRAIEQSDRIRGAENLYHEKLRPQFHFSARRGWNNDPNGLVLYEGEYHLFFQHNPYGWSWGNMHWGHAISRDLVHWKELPEALYPDEHGTMFSGSAVVDWNNTAGLQTGIEKPLVCIFTAAGKPFTQGLAYSNDRGRSWTKFRDNPVLPHLRAENRDPKVLWYAPEKKWLMALFLDQNDYALFSSPDLKHWEKLCSVRLPGASECPEFFPIAIEGESQAIRWVFYGGNGRYLVGKFDGQTFTPEGEPKALHAGNCWYASQTYNDIPAADGRRILLPWGTMATPGMPFNQMIGTPVALTLRRSADGLRLCANPVKELTALRTKSFALTAQSVEPGQNPLREITGELLELEGELSLGNATELEFKLRGVPVVYNVVKGEISCEGQAGSLKPVSGRLRLRFLVDRTSIDLFGNEGELYMTVGVIPRSEDHSLELGAKGEGARIETLTVWNLRSAWQD